MANLLSQIRDLIPLSFSTNAAYVFLAFFCLVAVLGFVLLYLSHRAATRGHVFKIRKLALLFSLWITSSILWGGYYFSYHLAGAFDITIERSLFICLASCAAFLIFRRRPNFNMSKLVEIFIALFLGLSVVSMTIHGFRGLVPLATKPWYIFLVGYLIPGCGFFFTKYFLDPEKDYPVFFRILFALGTYVAIIAFFERFGLDSLIFPRYITDTSIGIHLDRARGPFLNAAFNGQLLAICFIAGMAVIPDLRSLKGLLCSAAMLLYFPAVWFTRTRSVYMQFLMIIIGLMLCYRTSASKWKLYSIPMVVLLFIVAVNIDRLASEDRQAGGVTQMKEVGIRFELVNKSLELISKHPALGVGLGQFRHTSLFSTLEAEYQHNQLIGITAELGLIGLGIYLAFLFIIFQRYFALISEIPDSGFTDLNFALLLGLALLATLINNTFVEPSLHIFSNLNFYIFAAMVDRLYNKHILGTTS